MDFSKEILLLDKPAGITSFDVIRKLRKEFAENNPGVKAPKMGHAGTLDPLATGLMIIGVGQGTKKLQDLIGLDKEYVAEILLGESRSTGDMEGKVLEERAVQESIEILEPKVNQALDGILGEIELPVSAYSAIKVDGKPMYKRARQAEKQGELVEDVPVRQMRVYEAELLNIKIEDKRAIAEVRFLVGSGTYIRSLAEEVGRRVGYPATLKNLRRTQIGEFKLADAVELK